MQLFICDLNKNRCSIDVNGVHITVQELKYLINDLLQIPAELQRLIYNGVGLADDRLLSDYNIQVGSVINLVSALRGD